MTKNNKNLKKKIGSLAFNFLSRNYSPDFLAEHLPSLFGQLSDIRYIPESELPKLKKLLNEKFENVEEVAKPTKTAKELLDQAGFILHDDIKSKKDYLKFKKYFASGESLCKFRSYDATSRYARLFWITRKNIDSIQRPSNPKRQDEYSTSCMSVGISEDTKTVNQITSRYNHTVSGCDNTYNSNLDNIVEGLTEAFNQDYNLNLGKSHSVEFDNFYINGGKYYHYHYEINGKKYGDNTIDGVIYDPNQFFIFDNFILDLKNKKIKTADNSQDGFVTLFNQHVADGYTIEIRKGDPDPSVDDKNKIIIYTKNN